jgi:hypothetical protein
VNDTLHADAALPGDDAKLAAGDRGQLRIPAVMSSFPQPFDMSMDAIVIEAGIRRHRRATRAADSHMTTTATATDVVERSSPPCLLGEFS